MFQHISIIGIGLIGSSLAYNIRNKKLAKKLTVIDIDPVHLKQAQDLKIADIYTSDVSEIRHCDGIILCIPVGSYVSLMRSIFPYIQKGTIVTDVGSTKK